MNPYNSKMGQKIRSHAPGIAVDHSFIAHVVIDDPIAGVADAILADQATSSSVETEVTEFLAQPDVPRQLTITPGGTTTDVAAGNIAIEGTDASGDVISEDVAIAADASAAVTTTRAFASITKITFPQQDGAGATFDVGTTDKIGIPFALAHNTVLKAYLGNALEATSPTVTTNANDWTKNLVDLNSALDGSQVDLYLIV